MLEFAPNYFMTEAEADNLYTEYLNLLNFYEKDLKSRMMCLLYLSESWIVLDRLDEAKNCISSALCIALQLRDERSYAQGLFLSANEYEYRGASFRSNVMKLLWQAI